MDGVVVASRRVHGGVVGAVDHASQIIQNLIHNFMVFQNPANLARGALGDGALEMCRKDDWGGGVGMKNFCTNDDEWKMRK